MIYLNNSYSLIQTTLLYLSKTPMICDHCYLIGTRYYRNECILHWKLRYVASAILVNHEPILVIFFILFNIIKNLSIFN